MTVHSIILANVLNFMRKHDFKNLIPTPVNDIISPEAPKYNHGNANIIEWMNRHNTGKLRNAISFKGPLFYFSYVTQHQCLATLNVFKKYTKSYVLSIQNSGSPIEWEGTNTPPYNVPGMPRSERENIPKISYKEI